MTQSDVCNWEIKMDNKTIQRWLTNVTLDQIYFNITFAKTDNLTVYMLQGNDIKSAKKLQVNPSLNQVFRYQTSLGMSIYIIAYPTNLNAQTITNLTFNYTLASTFFPLEGNNWIEEKLAKGEKDFLDSIIAFASQYYVVI